MIWRFRGSPHYLQRQGDRLGIHRLLVDQSGRNPEIHRASVLAGQLCERYHRASKVDGVASIGNAELSQVRGTLGQIEHEVAKLHALAAAAAEMSDEAHRAYGLEPPVRHFEVMSDFDVAAAVGIDPCVPHLPATQWTGVLKPADAATA